MNVWQIVQEPASEPLLTAKDDKEETAYASEPVRDALQKAVMDFEETLQRSSSGRQRSSKQWVTDLPLGKSHYVLPETRKYP